MAKRRQRQPFSLRDSIKPGRSMRIRIPQPPDRPLRLRTRNLVRKEFVSPDEPWFVLHRRGPKRQRIGIDPLEARAVSKEQVRGTLPERILYLAFVRVLHFVPDADFDFQSSLQGGRLELGGIVADFMFEWMRIIVQVQGPTHGEFLRGRKDEEQRGTLEEMGFKVLEVTDTLIYDEYRLEDWLRRNFGLRGGRGGSGGAFGPHDADEERRENSVYMELVWEEVQAIELKLDSLITELPALMG